MLRDPANLPQEKPQIGLRYEIRQPVDLSRVFLDAKGRRSYSDLLDAWNFTRSMGSIHGYVTGRCVTTIETLLKLMDAIGARLVIEPDEARSRPDGHAEVER